MTLVLALMLTACEKYEDPGNQNNPALEDFLLETTLDDLKLLASGTEASLKIDLGFYVETFSIVGREYYDLNGADPRYTGELLGAQGGPLDPGGFLTTRSYSARYRAVRSAQTLIDVMSTTSASLSAAEENGFVGFAQTVKAYALLLNANQQFQNGIRIDVADADNLGPFVSYDEALNAIADLLDAGYSNLDGAEFVFDLTSGFAGFDTPVGFRQFNRAIAARVDLYRGDNSGALDALDDSFYDQGASFNLGAYHSYNTGDGLLNPLFNPADDDMMAVTSWVTDAEEGDARLAKVDSTASVTLDDLTSSYRVVNYSSSDANVIIIRNEELILINAEANIGTNNTAAVAGINIIRSNHGLGDFVPNNVSDNNEILEQLLHERRYSLFGEAHRWIDMRRYDRLDELTIERTGDIVHVQFPRPLQEGN